jgi:hypothetical protein
MEEKKDETTNRRPSMDGKGKNGVRKQRMF